MFRTGSALSVLVLLALLAAGFTSQSSPSLASAKAVPGYTKIECEAIVNAPLADAWNCWATSEGAETFFAPHAQIEPQPGGSFEIWFNPTGEPGTRGAEGLKVLSVLPGEMLSFEWNAPPKFAHARPQNTWVVVTFEPIDDAHTRIRLVHLGWDEMKMKHPDHIKEWDEVRAYFENAWPMVLSWMKRRFDEGPRWDAGGTSLWKG